MWSNNDGMDPNWKPFKLERRDECAVCFVKKSYVEKLEKVVEAVRELIRNNDSLDRESVLMKDVDAIRSVLETLDEARRG